MGRLLGAVVTRLVVVTIISLMAAGVYLCCFVGALSARRRQP